MIFPFLENVFKVFNFSCCLAAGYKFALCFQDITLKL